MEEQQEVPMEHHPCASVEEEAVCSVSLCFTVAWRHDNARSLAVCPAGQVLHTRRVCLASSWVIFQLGALSLWHEVAAASQCFLLHLNRAHAPEVATLRLEAQ